MPVRPLGQSVFRWPDAETVLAAARQWAERLAASDSGVLAVGCFGSYARGQAGVGSDLDLIVIVGGDSAAVDPRSDVWAVERLPVPTDRLVYTVAQWDDLRESDSRFWRTLAREARWLVGSPPAERA
jgi:predicted nucleotidyltransferase